jgi:outer membrane protein TolC
MRASTQHLIATRAKGLYEQYELVRTTLASLDKTAIPAQERLVDATVGAYRSGKSDFVRVLQARRDLAQARARRLDLVLAAWHRLGEMTALTGDLP